LVKEMVAMGLLEEATVLAVAVVVLAQMELTQRLVTQQAAVALGRQTL